MDIEPVINNDLVNFWINSFDENMAETTKSPTRSKYASKPDDLPCHP